MIERVRLSGISTVGRWDWKSKKSSGSTRAKRVAPREDPTMLSAAAAASPASSQPVNAHTSAGARRPSGRRSQIKGCIRFTVQDGLMASATTDPALAVATLRPGQDVVGVFACARKDRLVTRSGAPY